MRPSGSPDLRHLLRLPPPPGRSRESSICLDADGFFWHDGRRVEHAGMGAALHRWIDRHPDDGRYILINGYDWTYITVMDAPYVVRALRMLPDRVMLVLSDGTAEAWDPADTRVGGADALYTSVKRGASGGPFDAKFTRHAQASLASILVDGSPPSVEIGGHVHVIGANAAAFG